MKKLLSIICAFALMLGSPVLAHEDDETSGTTASISDMEAEAEEFIQQLRSLPNRITLERRGFGARDEGRYQENLSLIKAVEDGFLQVSNGTVGVEYDVILQPGHYWRTTGSTGTQRTVEEREIAAFITSIIFEELDTLGHNVVVIPADNFNRPLNGKVFLSIHADAVREGTLPCASGPSMGYDDGSDEWGVHAMGLALSSATGFSYPEFMRDGFTKNLREYYAFKHMRTSMFEGVLEIGELTCPSDEEVLIEQADVIGRNIATMLDTLLTLEGG